MKNDERTNRWLLIGAALLAVLAGVLVFAALTNVGGGGDDEAKPAAGGDVTVLVAARTIKPNEKITADMFKTVSVPASQQVANPATVGSSVVGKVARTEIIEGQQISLAQVSLSDKDVNLGLAVQLPKDKVGIALGANEISLVAGFVQAGDRVNVMGVFKETRDLPGRPDVELTRVELILQNVEVLAVAQDPVAPVSAVDAEGTPIAQTGSAVGSTSTRPEDVEPNPSAGSVTLALTLADAQVLAAARSQGDIFMQLRPLGENDTQPIEPTYYDEFGLLGLLPRR
jgi:pilus assembly protein CpaB